MATIVKKKVLILDDYPAILESLEFVLKDLGFEVELMSDGNKLIERQDHFPDLILLDIWMKEVNGFDVYKKMQNQDATKTIPIILMSADAKLEKTIAPENFLAKPFSLQDLFEKINYHLKIESFLE